MLTDEQCNDFRRLPLSFNDMVRAIFRAGFIAGDASDCGAMGKALKDLEEAVRADRIGCYYIKAQYDDKGAWLKDSFVSTRSVLGRLDRIRSAITS